MIRVNFLSVIKHGEHKRDKRESRMVEWRQGQRLFSVVHEKHDNHLDMSVAVEIQLNEWIQRIGGKSMGHDDNKVRSDIKIRPIFLTFVEHFVFYWD